MESIEFRYSPTAKQIMAHNEYHKYIGYGGSAGSGKSHWLCVEAFLNCHRHAGIRQFLGRKISKAFRETTLVTWQRVVPQGAYRYNEQKKEITVYTGKKWNSIIQCGGITDREDLNAWGSAEYGWIGFDQAEELTMHDYEMVLPRLRFNMPDGTPLTDSQLRACFVANPADCAFKNLFIKDPTASYVFIPALPSDNPYLDPQYIPRLREVYRYRPELIKAMIEGNWDIMEGSNIIIKSAWVEKALGRGEPGIWENKVGVSCDVSRYGDDETVIYGLAGALPAKKDIFSGQDTYAIAARCWAMCKSIRGNFIVVDVIGVGAGVVDSLRQMVPKDIRVVEFNSSEKADDPTRFYNKRAEAWWEVGQMFSQGLVALPRDPVLEKQLSSVEYSFSNGRILIEAKDDIKVKLGQSPDRADALVMGLSYLAKAPDQNQDEEEKARVRKRQRFLAQKKREYSYETGEIQTGYLDSQ